jgi:hypothetical protein
MLAGGGGWACAYLKGTRQTAAGEEEEAAGPSHALEVEVEAEVGAEAVAAVAIVGEGDGISDLGEVGKRVRVSWWWFARQAAQQQAAFCFCLLEVDLIWIYFTFVNSGSLGWLSLLAVSGWRIGEDASSVAAFDLTMDR